MDRLDTQHIVTNISNMASDHGSGKKDNGRDAIVAVNIIKIMKRSAAIKVVLTGVLLRGGTPREYTFNKMYVLGMQHHGFYRFDSLCKCIK